MGLSPGTRLGAYEIVSPIGAGGMGEVYRARDTRLARDVAVKVLPENFSEGEKLKARFEREAKLLAALNHPNIAAIHSFEEISGRHILVMELLEGTTLRDRLDSGSIPPNWAGRRSRRSPTVRSRSRLVTSASAPTLVRACTRCR